MRIITIHCDYIRFRPLKKAIKNIEELSDKEKKEKEIKDPLVVLTAVEKGDNDEIIRQLIDSIKKTAEEVKAKKIVLYPYAHLSSHLADPTTAKEYLVESAAALEKLGFEVTRAPFGYYKEFELKCKGHPLSELSKEFRPEGIGTQKTKEVSKEEKDEDTSKILNQLSRSKLDTSKLKDNDHRILGQKLDLFSFNEAAPGQPFWHNKGLIIINELSNYSKEIHRKEGYQEISTPFILNNKLWKVSGHWDLYKENMFLTDYEGRDFAFKPMNCPGAMLVYKSKSRSYKELPLRLAELGTVHRKELSGVLSGLLRVIKITQDDAHIFVSEDSLQNEIINVIKLFKELLDKFNFKYSFTISVRSEEKKNKYLGEDKLWMSAEKALAEGLKKLKLKYEIIKGEAKFYGPSLDVVIRDSLDREWQCSTLQLDFNMPKRFELSYIGPDNKEYTPIVLHRVIYGSLERFIGILLEHFNGALPFWLSPIQVRIINFTDRNIKAAEKILSEIREALPNLRIDSDFRSTTISDKIRDAEMQRINYTITIGDKEEESKTLAVRARGEKPKFNIKIQDFIKDIREKIEKRE